MSRIEVVFDSKYGHSAKVAEHVAELGRRRGHTVQLVRALSATPLDLRSVDAVVVVAPVFFGKHMKSVDAFVRAQADVIASRPSILLSVSGSAGSKDVDERVDAMALARRFADEAGARFRAVDIVGGAMAYPSYNPLVRWLIKRISARRGGPTDTSRSHESTDWAALDRTMVNFFGLLPEARAQAAHA